MEATALTPPQPVKTSAVGHRPRVVVLGAGFAGLNCARKLGRLDVDVTVVDRNNCNIFQPLLYQVALASLAPSQIASPVRSVLKGSKNTDVVMDEITHVDLDHRRVELSSGTELTYDYLVVATGSEKSFFGHPEWEAFAPGLKTVEDALEIRQRILLAFETAERETLRTGTHAPLDFLIIGGGPTGVELAGAVAEMTNYFLRKDFSTSTRRSRRSRSSMEAQGFWAPIRLICQRARYINSTNSAWRCATTFASRRLGMVT